MPGQGIVDPEPLTRLFLGHSGCGRDQITEEMAFGKGSENVQDQSKEKPG